MDKVIERFFTDILPKTKVEQGLERINVPIFLAAGLSDYDCCPWLWKDLPNLPSHMTVSLFKNSGHYPQYEEAALFDARVIEWAKNDVLRTIS